MLRAHCTFVILPSVYRVWAAHFFDKLGDRIALRPLPVCMPMKKPNACMREYLIYVCLYVERPRLEVSNAAEHDCLTVLPKHTRTRARANSSCAAVELPCARTVEPQCARTYTHTHTRTRTHGRYEPECTGATEHAGFTVVPQCARTRKHIHTHTLARTLSVYISAHTLSVGP